ncbi:MarR family transcriptional regulator [Rhizobium sp. 16-449-1b]|uniref:MarR family winged helix-turn-helix transcriptional regulator n=1 Tax=Rhizobium sp. 16-449-1b TaxID=2819989 RepID=UPI001ADB3BA3|nr:MarR family transcriptional regulator [Rhizobium sp. 16-449-1b]MBO9197882.1 MarR family transcriptional regulator [Rhizobium sp. 16-449-1b]
MTKQTKPLSRRAAVTSSMLQAGSIWKRMAEKALAEDGISASRANLLLLVNRSGGGVRQVQLADSLGLASQSLVRLLDELTASGHIERRDDPDDRRAKTIWLTRDGQELADRVERVIASLRDRVLRNVEDADIEAAYRVLDAIVRASGENSTND